MPSLEKAVRGMEEKHMHLIRRRLTSLALGQPQMVQEAMSVNLLIDDIDRSRNTRVGLAVVIDLRARLSMWRLGV